jgi:nitrogen fixation NifU-like protein
MNDLQDLYQEVIIDHGRRPRNKAVMDNPTLHAYGKNPLCGDNITVYIQLENNVIKNVSFSGEGCAISTASASLMTERVMGKTMDEARKIFHAFHHMLTVADCVIDDESLGKLHILSGVQAYPARVKCATLAWHTLTHALDRSLDVATTE